MEVSALIIDDDYYGWDVVRNKVTKFGYNIRVINDSKNIDNATDAIRIIKEEMPEFIFLDLKLNNSTGFEVLDFLAKDNLNINVIIISSYAGEPENIKKIVHSGAYSNLRISWLSKPFEDKDLKKSIQYFLDINKIKILITEDDELSWKRIDNFLQKEDDLLLLNNKPIKTSKESIEYLERYSPDIIILDLALYNSTGFEVLEYIREERLDIFVVFISGVLENTEYEKEMAKYGELRSVYLSKPLNEQELLDVLRRGRQSLTPTIGKQKIDNNPAFNFFVKGIKSVVNRLEWGLSTALNKIDNLEKQIAPEKAGFPLSRQKGIVIIRFSDLVYCEVDGNGTLLYLLNHATGKLYQEKTTKRMNSLIKEMSFPRSFCRIHTSTFVNLDFLDRIGTSKNRIAVFKLPKNQSITLEISAKKYTETVEFITDYIENHF